MPGQIRFGQFTCSRCEVTLQQCGGRKKFPAVSRSNCHDFVNGV